MIACWLSSVTISQRVNNRGATLHASGRYEEEEAVASYDRAIALKPDYPDALVNRGDALLELKQLKEALASYESRAVCSRPARRAPMAGEAMCS